MALTARQERELTARYLRRVDRLSLAGGQTVEAAWRRIRGLDEADIARLRRLALPAVTAISQQAAATSVAFFGLLLEEPVVAAATVVEPDWRGPFTRSWAALGRGDDLETAVAAGAARADAAGRDAVMSTSRLVGDEVGSDKVSGWRRAPGPGSCEWCIEVSGRVYSTAAAADFGHERCNCGVVPVMR